MNNKLIRKIEDYLHEHSYKGLPETRESKLLNEVWQNFRVRTLKDEEPKTSQSVIFIYETEKGEVAQLGQYYGNNLFIDESGNFVENVKGWIPLNLGE